MNIMTSQGLPIARETPPVMVPPRPTPVLFTDEANLCDWIAYAAPGATMLYFRGYLAADRLPSRTPFREEDRKRLVAVARRAMQAAEAGLVHLVQRRHGPLDYAYLAVKARPRPPARVIPAAAMARR
ncbi:MAG: hypothetical protein P9C48_08720 [Defluviicoccus sp.]|nr:hypothetical protein [Defluviicoccus sp.]MDG4609197.1 hypothetical protein [Defluviicoccus sp.]